MGKYEERVNKYIDERGKQDGGSIKRKFKGQITSKMRTLMIGTLAQIENFMGAEWGHGLTDSECTDDQLDKRAVWKRLRESILDFGNLKIRESEKEIDKYKIELFLNRGRNG